MSYTREDIVQEIELLSRIYREKSKYYARMAAKYRDMWDIYVARSITYRIVGEELTELLDRIGK